MALDKKYIFIIETEGVGYVMGSYDDEAEAMTTFNEVWDDIYQEHDTPYLVRNPPLLTYKIHPTGTFFYPDSLECRTSGLLTTLIYKNEFPIEEFMFLREHTVYAISLDEYKDEMEITDATMILAN